MITFFYICMCIIVPSLAVLLGLPALAMFAFAAHWVVQLIVAGSLYLWAELVNAGRVLFTPSKVAP